MVMAQAMQVAIAGLTELVQPVHEFDMRIAAQLGERRRRFDRTKQRRVELQEQCSAGQGHGWPSPRPHGVHACAKRYAACAHGGIDRDFFLPLIVRSLILDAHDSVEAIACFFVPSFQQ